MHQITTKITNLPRTLVLQLKRYVFVGEEPTKIQANVGIPKFLALDEYVKDDVKPPPEWKCNKPSRRRRLSSTEAAVESPLQQAERVTLDAALPVSMPQRTHENGHSELQEARRGSMEKDMPADSYGHPCALSLDDSLTSADPAGNYAYRLVGIVSHCGGGTHSGHHVSDVYSVGRDKWYTATTGASVVSKTDLGEERQRNGYILLYLHEDICCYAAKLSE